MKTIKHVIVEDQDAGMFVRYPVLCFHWTKESVDDSTLILPLLLLLLLPDTPPTTTVLQCQGVSVRLVSIPGRRPIRADFDACFASNLSKFCLRW